MNIPKTIIQTSRSGIPEYVVRMHKKTNPDWIYLHFSDQDIVEFFDQNPLPDFPHIKKVFHSFSNGAHRADLFRYYYLYINGGVYLDSDALMSKGLTELCSGYEFITVESYHENRKLIFNGFIATVPKHLLMYKALQHAYAVKNSELQDDYFLICAALYEIISRQHTHAIQLYAELPPKTLDICTSAYQRDGVEVLRHYRYCKTLPDRAVSFSSMIRNIMCLAQYSVSILRSIFVAIAAKRRTVN